LLPRDLHAPVGARCERRMLRRFIADRERIGRIERLPRGVERAIEDTARAVGLRVPRDHRAIAAGERDSRRIGNLCAWVRRVRSLEARAAVAGYREQHAWGVLRTVVDGRKYGVAAYREHGRFQ